MRRTSCRLRFGIQIAPETEHLFFGWAIITIENKSNNIVRLLTIRAVHKSFGLEHPQHTRTPASNLNNVQRSQ